ncbi:MAG: WbqC family protein, partial [Bacteroidetes bacterium]|nr:WbqC family protein [Bacteroidota bacterium]
ISQAIHSFSQGPVEIEKLQKMISMLTVKGYKHEAVALLETLLRTYQSEGFDRHPDVDSLNDQWQYIRENFLSVGIHQPNFLPWIGYFHKIYVSDVFIFHNNVEFTRKSPTKRTLIRKHPGSAETIYLSVPLKHTGDHTLIKDLLIDHSVKWQKKWVNHILNSYRKTPFFDEYFPVIEDVIMKSRDIESFSEFSIQLTKSILYILGIHKDILISSQLPVSGEKSAYNINLVKYCTGNIYNSGLGARKYQSEEEFTRNGIRLTYIDTFNYLERNKAAYPENFLNGVSIIDTFFHFGKEFILKIFREYSDILNGRRIL